MFLAMKIIPEERTSRFLDEIDRAEKIFKKMFDGGELEAEINSAKDARQAAHSIRRVLR